MKIFNFYILLQNWQDRLSVVKIFEKKLEICLKIVPIRDHFKEFHLVSLILNFDVLWLQNRLAENLGHTCKKYCRADNDDTAANIIYFLKNVNYPNFHYLFLDQILLRKFYDKSQNWILMMKMKWTTKNFLVVGTLDFFDDDPKECSFRI